MLLGLFGLLVAWRWPHRKRLWRSLLVLGPVVLYVFSIAPVSNGLWRALEDSGPADSIRADVTYDVVIVLGGTVELLATDPAPGGKRSFNDNVERLHAAYDLMRTGRAKNAIL